HHRPLQSRAARPACLPHRKAAEPDPPAPFLPRQTSDIVAARVGPLHLPEGRVPRVPIITLPISRRDSASSPESQTSLPSSLYPSNGLLTPTPGFCITCVKICIVATSVCPSRSCTVRMSQPLSSRCVAKE